MHNTLASGNKVRETVPLTKINNSICEELCKEKEYCTAKDDENMKLWGDDFKWSIKQTKALRQTTLIP